MYPPPKGKVVTKAIHEHGGKNIYLWFPTRRHFEIWAYKLATKFPSTFSVYLQDETTKRFTHRVEVNEVMPGLIQIVYFNPQDDIDADDCYTDLDE